MVLTPGSRLGVYDITAQIGQGGMGQVYRATDTKLKRQVAIKILPPSLAADHDRLARFQREAEVLASLNHPNIAAIYGLEEREGVSALVMELVEGDDLSERIARGAIPLDEALAIAKQIAEALEAAHEQGVIHRDLKPANIKVRSDGTVKVLDFGLAKALEPAASVSQSMSMSPTITTPAMTQAGIILGTAAYMSPEQARGKTVDRRADVWAFGAVLFEMLTGQRAFPGENLTDTLAAVVKLDPKWDAIGPDVPVRVCQVLRVCLQKDPRQRAQAIGDVRLALEGAFETAVPGTRQTSAPARALPWVSSAAALVFAIAWLIAWAPWRTRTPMDRPLLRLNVDLGADVSLPAPAFNAGSGVAITPDGTRLVYASGSPTKLFTRRLDQTKATELPGTQGATLLFVSPDSQWVGFVSGRMVYKVSVEGGAVVPLGGEANVTGGASWGEDGSLFVSSLQKLLRIPAGGGPSEIVAESRDGELGLVEPEPLPGGNAILFAADNPGPVDKTTIEVVTLANRERKTLVHGGASPRYLATGDGAGHLVYVNQATLFAIPFDPHTLETHGTAVPVVDDVASERTIGIGQFDVSRSGTLVYRSAIGGGSTLTTLQWVDATGRKQPLQARPGAYEDLSLSPDGTRIALTVTEGASQDVWVYDAQRDVMTRLTFGGASYRGPTWSPDGLYVVFSAVGNGIFQARADGASQPQALTQSRTVQYPRSFTPDGKRLAYYENLGGAGGAGQLWTVPLVNEGGQLKAGRAESFLKSNSIDRFPSFSPDGHWLAYESSESGRAEVYVRAFPRPPSGPGGKWQISTNGGAAPHWSRSEHELLYQSDGQILAASYTVKGDTFVADKPRVWIAQLGAAPAGLGGSTWDVAQDGKRVVVLTRVESADAPKQEHEVVFLLNFFDELRRRVPLGK